MGKDGKGRGKKMDYSAESNREGGSDGQSPNGNLHKDIVELSVL